MFSRTACNRFKKLTAGTPGLSRNGDLPKDIAGQAEQAWEHVVDTLTRAGMTVAGVVKVTQYLTRAEDILAYGKVRTRFLDAKRTCPCLKRGCGPRHHTMTFRLLLAFLRDWNVT